jgi:hypothetical protein
MKEWEEMALIRDPTGHKEAYRLNIYTKWITVEEEKY